MKNGKHWNSLIPICFMVNFEKNIIARSSKVKGAWSREEITENLYPNIALNPLQRGILFEILEFIVNR